MPDVRTRYREFHSITVQSNCWRHVPETVKPLSDALLKAAMAEGSKKKHCKSRLGVSF